MALSERMRICMILYDPQEFGGSEEYVTTLAVGLQERGQHISVLCATWLPYDNQYYQRLRKNGVTFVQWPRWFSQPASHWPTKEKIAASLMRIFGPIGYLLGACVFLFKRRSWRQSLISSNGWLHGQLMSRLIGPDWRPLLTRLLLSCWRIRWHPDIIHVHAFHSHTSNALFVVDWATRNKVLVIYEEHQTPDARFGNWEEYRETVNKSTLVVAVSEESARALRTVCGITRPIFVSGPLVPDPYELGQREQAATESLREPIRVTTVARFHVMKGLPYLLEAMARIKATFPATQFRIYGDGPLRQELHDQASKLGLDDGQVFVGTFDHHDLPRIMEQTDIFVMSSILEGQPVSLVEAMAFGRPIVATSVGGIPELIEDGVSGLLCPPGDSASLAHAVSSLVENSSLRRRLGNAARKSYEHGAYQPASVCERFLAIYNIALQTPSQSGSSNTH